MNLRILAIFLAAMALFTAGRVNADEIVALRLEDPDRYFEAFLGAKSRAAEAKLVAPDRAVVGLQLGYGSGPFAIGDILAAVPMKETLALCVQISSPDGRYWSLNGYKPLVNALRPVHVETRSQFVAQLAARYTSDEIPIVIRATNRCEEDGSNGALIAAIPPGATETDKLVVFLNAPGSRAGVGLVDREESSIATGRCVAPTRDGSIAFTQICALPIASVNPARVSHLVVTLVGDSGEPIRTKYELSLPESAR